MNLRTICRSQKSIHTALNRHILITEIYYYAQLKDKSFFGIRKMIDDSGDMNDR